MLNWHLRWRPEWQSPGDIPGDVPKRTAGVSKGSRVRLPILLRVGISVVALASLWACGGVQPPVYDLAAPVYEPASAGPENFAVLDRWNAVTARFARQQSDPAAFCPAGANPANCPAARWARLVAELKQLRLRDRVARADAALNRLPYVPAARNWGDPFYWETPYEFLAKGGQCQDFAIAKFLALVQSGVPETSLRFVVVHDRVDGLDHAVTLATVKGVILLLDNQIKDVVPAAEVDRYTPYYAINDTGLWIAHSDGRASNQNMPRPDGGFVLAHY